MAIDRQRQSVFCVRYSSELRDQLSLDGLSSQFYDRTTRRCRCQRLLAGHDDERQGATVAPADTTEEGFVVVIVSSSSGGSK